MGLKLDGIAASSAVDTSSEAIDIEGLDISSLQNGEGVINHEHNGPKAPGASFLNVLGAITYARKIFGEDDCEDDRQRYYWKQIELPFVYIRGELFDDQGHPGAVAAAAIIRWYSKSGLPIVLRYSIDGHTIAREGNILKRCVARDVALTCKPANKSCISGVLDENPKAKTSGTLDELSRSEDGLVRLPGVEFRMMGLDDASPMTLIRQEVSALQEMTKAMTAGGGMAAPGNLSQGAALAKEDVQGRLKRRLTTAFRDWRRGNTLHEHLVKALPDIHEDFLKKFVDLITEARLRKASELHEYLNKALDGAKGMEAKIQGLGPAFEADAVKTKVEGKGAPKKDGNATNVVGPPKSVGEKPAGPKPFSAMGADDRKAKMAAVNADAARSNPAAAAHQAAQPGLPVPQPIQLPHVPGLRVGVQPDEAPAKDAAAHITPSLIGGINAAIAAGSPVAAQIQGMRPVAKREPGEDDDTPLPAAPATIRGEAIAPNPKVRTPKFDEDRGVYDTPWGSFPISIPSRQSQASRDKFHELLNDPKVSQAHDYAMGHWMRLNQLMRERRLPPAVVMHAALFSMLSANKSVPAQELMYGHLVDHMRETGLDATSQAFGDPKNIKAWGRRDNPTRGPELSREYFEAHPGVRVKSGETDTGRRVGQFLPFSMQGMKPGEQGYSMAKYHELHDFLMGLVNKHGADGRLANRELMAEKNRAAGLDVLGLKQKTGRYALSMMGSGNTMVPDTHFIRHLFGLDVDKDSPTIKRLKLALWSTPSNNTANLEGIDRYYFRNHDAVQHMLEHPKHGKFFRDNPESAIFPAFWKHWTAIVPHERFNGLSVPKENATNELTTHQPYFEGIQDALKAEADDPNFRLASKSAALHSQWADKHGETAALLMYFQHLLPHLISASGLHKAEPSSWSQAEMPPKPPLPIKIRGKAVQPGEIRYRDDLQHPMAGQTLKLVGSTPTHHEVLSGSGPSAALMRIPRDLEGKAYEVTRPAVPFVVPNALGPEHLHEAGRSPEQLALASRLDFSQPRRFINDEGVHATRGMPPWTQGNPKVFVKPSANYLSGDWVMKPDAAIREMAFHNVARDAFGLGALVPPTIAFWHPEDGKLHSAQEFVQGKHVKDPEVLRSWHQQGLSPRMAVMDYVLGNDDRWAGNFMQDASGAPRLIDHGAAFQYTGGHGTPEYVHPEDRHASFTPEVAQWVNQLDPKALNRSMVNSSMPPPLIDSAQQRLAKIKQIVASGQPLGYNHLVK